MPAPSTRNTYVSDTSKSNTYVSDTNYRITDGRFTLSVNFLFDKNIVSEIKKKELETWGLSISSNVLSDNFCLPITFGTIIKPNGISLYGGLGLGFSACPVIVYGLGDVGYKIVSMVPNERIKDKLLFGGGGGIMLTFEPLAVSAEVHWTTQTKLIFMVGIGFLVF